MSRPSWSRNEIAIDDRIVNWDICIFSPSTNDIWTASGIRRASLALEYVSRRQKLSAMTNSRDRFVSAIEILHDFNLVSGKSPAISI
jgi:hypothetical protein